MPRKKLFIYLESRYPFWAIQDRHIESLRQQFPDLEIVVAREESDAIQKIADADYCFCWRLPEVLLQAAKQLKWVHTPSAGRDYIDSVALQSRPIEFTNSQGYHGIFMAQHAMGMLLYFARSFPISLKTFWPRDEIAANFFDLIQAKMLIVGCGSIGIKLAKLAKAFDMNVLGYRRQIPAENPEGIQWVTLDELPQAIHEARVVVNLLPGTKETHHFFDTHLFKHFSKNSVFLNLGRGNTVDEEALLQFLDEDILLGCGLDVLEKEPPKEEHRLFRHPKVLLTPHSSAFSYSYLDHAMVYFSHLIKDRENASKDLF